MQADKNTSIFLKSYDRSKWEKVRLGDICSVTTGKLDANAMHPYGKYAFFTCAKEVYKINNYAFDTEALLISGNGSHVGYVHYYKGKFNAYQRTYVLDNFSVNIIFIKHLLDNKLAKRINIEKKSGNTPYILRNTLCDMEILKPVSTDEQFAIVDALQCVDSCISNLEKLISKQENIKKSTEKMLLTPKPGWKEVKIRDCLDYEQPTDYIVHTDINASSGTTPVLTANKAFVLGYTDETNNIYNKGDTIIYDDFTMDMKYVTFPFKVKSSAMKILTPKGENNLYFMFALLKSFGLTQQEHARSYISKLEPMKILIPDPATQETIAENLYTIDSYLENLKHQLDKIKKLKQGLMSYFFG